MSTHDSTPVAGPSSPRRSQPLSPSRREGPFRSTDALSPELPPTYNSIGSHVGSVAPDDDVVDISTERGRLLERRDSDVKGKRRSSDEELDALRLDLDGVGHSTPLSAEAQEDENESTRLAMTNIDQRKALWWKNTLITGLFIASWYFFATLLSLYNKWMFSPQYYGFSFPLFVTFCHMIVQFCLAGVMRVVWAKQFRPDERPTRRDYVVKIMPTAISTGGDIGLSNLSLKTITLSLYTMCKSSTLIFVLIAAFAFKLESYSLRLIAVISLISFGVFLMLFDTTTVDIPGIIMVFSASALSGLRWALTETVMHKKSMGLSNPFATIFWLAPLMAVVLGGVSLGMEGWSTVFHSDHFDSGRGIFTVLAIVFPGALAFSMVASEYFIIQRAGIIPLSIAGIFKEVTTISISAIVFGDQLTEVNIIGVMIAIIGIALYTYHKYQKSITTPVPLEPSDHRYTAVNDTTTSGVPLEHLDSPNPNPNPTYPPITRERETEEDRTQRLRDEFEGWGRESSSWSGDDADPDEVDEDEVERRMAEREGGKGVGKGGKWGEWWGKEM